MWPPVADQTLRSPINSQVAQSKISSSDIVKDGSQQMLEKARDMVAAETPSATGTKRKAAEAMPEELTMPELEISSEEATTEEAPTDAATRPSSKRRKTVSSLAGHAASAVAGGIGVVMFLNSQWSQNLIDWLA